MLANRILFWSYEQTYIVHFYEKILLKANQAQEEKQVSRISNVSLC